MKRYGVFLLLLTGLLALGQVRVQRAYSVLLDPAPADGVAPGVRAAAWGAVSVHLEQADLSDPFPLFRVFPEGVGAACAAEDAVYVGLGGGDVAVLDFEGTTLTRLPVFASEDPALAACLGSTAVLAAPGGEAAVFENGLMVAHAFLPARQVLEVRAGPGRGAFLVLGNDGRPRVYELGEGAPREVGLGVDPLRSSGEWGWDASAGGWGVDPRGHLERGGLAPGAKELPPGWVRLDGGDLWVNLRSHALGRGAEGAPGVVGRVTVLRNQVRGLAVGARGEVFASDNGMLWRIRVGPASARVMAHWRAPDEEAFVWPLAYGDGVLYGFLDKAIHRWRAETLEEDGKLPARVVSALAVGPDGEVLVGGRFGSAYAQERGLIRNLVNTDTGEVVRIFAWRNAAGERRTLVVGKRRVVYLGEEGERVAVRVPAGMRVLEAALSPSRDRLVLVGDELAVLRLPPVSGATFDRRRSPVAQWIPSAAFVSDRVLALGTSRGEILFYDLEEEREAAPRVRGLLASVQWLVSPAPGYLVASTGRSCCPGTLSVFKLETRP